MKLLAVEEMGTRRRRGLFVPPWPPTGHHHDDHYHHGGCMIVLERIVTIPVPLLPLPTGSAASPCGPMGILASALESEAVGCVVASWCARRGCDCARRSAAVVSVLAVQGALGNCLAWPSNRPSRCRGILTRCGRAARGAYSSPHSVRSFCG